MHSNSLIRYNRSLMIGLGLYVGLIQYLPLSLCHIECIRMALYRIEKKNSSFLIGALKNKVVIATFSGVIIAQLLWIASIYYHPLYILCMKPHVWSLFFYLYIIPLLCDMVESGDFFVIKTQYTIENRYEARDMFLRTFFGQLCNPIVWPNSILSRLMSLYLFRYSQINSFLISTVIGVLGAQVLSILIICWFIGSLQRSSLQGNYKYYNIIFDVFFRIFVAFFTILTFIKVPIHVLTADSPQYEPRDLRLRSPWPALLFDVSLWMRPLEIPSFYTRKAEWCLDGPNTETDLFRSHNKFSFSQYFFEVAISNSKRILSHNYPETLALVHSDLETALDIPYLSEKDEEQISREWIDTKTARRKHIHNLLLTKLEQLNDGAIVGEVQYSKLSTKVDIGKLNDRIGHFTSRYANISRVRDPRLSKYNRGRTYINEKWKNGTIGTLGIVEPNFFRLLLNYLLMQPSKVRKLCNRLKKFMAIESKKLDDTLTLPWNSLGDNIEPADAVLNAQYSKLREQLVLGRRTDKYGRKLSKKGNIVVSDKRVTIYDRKRKLTPEQQALAKMLLAENKAKLLGFNWVSILLSCKNFTDPFYPEDYEIDEEIDSLTGRIMERIFELESVLYNTTRKLKMFFKFLLYESLKRFRNYFKDQTNQVSKQILFLEELFQPFCSFNMQFEPYEPSHQEETDEELVRDKYLPLNLSFNVDKNRRRKYILPMRRFNITPTPLMHLLEKRYKNKFDILKQETLAEKQARITQESELKAIKNKNEIQLNQATLIETPYTTTIQMFRGPSLIAKVYLRRYVILPFLIILKNIARMLLFQKPEFTQDFSELGQESYLYCDVLGDFDVGTANTEYLHEKEKLFTKSKIKAKKIAMKMAKDKTIQSYEATNLVTSRSGDKIVDKKVVVPRKSRTILKSLGIAPPPLKTQKRQVPSSSKPIIRPVKTKKSPLKNRRLPLSSGIRRGSKKYNTVKKTLSNQSSKTAMDQKPKMWFIDGLQVRIMNPFVLKPWHVSLEEQQEACRAILSKKLDGKIDQAHFNRLEIKLLTLAEEEKQKVPFCYLSVFGKETIYPSGPIYDHGYSFWPIVKKAIWFTVRYRVSKLYSNIRKLLGPVKKYILRVYRPICNSIISKVVKFFSILKSWFIVVYSKGINSVSKEITSQDISNNSKLDTELLQKEDKILTLKVANKNVLKDELAESKQRTEALNARYQAVKKRFSLVNIANDYKLLFEDLDKVSTESTYSVIDLPIDRKLIIDHYKWLQIQAIWITVRRSWIYARKMIYNFFMIELPCWFNMQVKLLPNRKKYFIYLLVEEREKSRFAFNQFISNLQFYIETAYIKFRELYSKNEIEPNLVQEQNKMLLTQAYILSKIWQSNLFTNPSLDIIEEDWNSSKALKNQMNNILERQGILNIHHPNHFNNTHWNEWLKNIPRFVPTSEVTSLIWPNNQDLSSLVQAYWKESNINTTFNPDSILGYEPHPLKEKQEALINGAINWSKRYRWYQLLQAYIDPDHGLKMNLSSNVSEDYIYSKSCDLSFLEKRKDQFKYRRTPTGRLVLKKNREAKRVFLFRRNEGFLNSHKYSFRACRRTVMKRKNKNLFFYPEDDSILRDDKLHSMLEFLSGPFLEMLKRDKEDNGNKKNIRIESAWTILHNTFYSFLKAIIFSENILIEKKIEEIFYLLRYASIKQRAITNLSPHDKAATRNALKHKMELSRQERIRIKKQIQELRRSIYEKRKQHNNNTGTDSDSSNTATISKKQRMSILDGTRADKSFSRKGYKLSSDLDNLSTQIDGSISRKRDKPSIEQKLHVNTGEVSRKTDKGTNTYNSQSKSVILQKIYHKWCLKQKSNHQYDTQIAYSKTMGGKEISHVSNKPCSEHTSLDVKKINQKFMHKRSLKTNMKSHDINDRIFYDSMEEWHATLMPEAPFVYSVLSSIDDYNPDPLANKGEFEAFNRLFMREIPNSDRSNLIPFFIPEDIMSTDINREYRVLESLDLNTDTDVHKNRHEDTSVSAYDQIPRQASNDTEKLMTDFGVIKRFLWPTHRLEDLACMNRFWLGIHKQSKFSSLTVKMYPPTKR